MAKRRKNYPGEKRQKYGIGISDIATWFGFKNEGSFNSSTAKERYLNGVEQVIGGVEKVIVDKLK